MNISFVEGRKCFVIKLPVIPKKRHNIRGTNLSRRIGGLINRYIIMLVIMIPNNILKKRSPRVLEAKIKDIINKIKLDVLYIYIYSY